MNAALRNQFGGHAVKPRAGLMAADGASRRTRSRRGCSLRRTPDPFALVIFGASGDLTHKKLMPALYALALRRLLPSRFAIVGVARTEGSDDAFREDMKQAVQQHARDEFRQDVWDELAAAMHYVATDFADEGGEDALADRLTELDARAAARRQPRLLLRRAAGRVPDDRRGARQAAHGDGLDAADRREAVRPRPRVRARR